MNGSSTKPQRRVPRINLYSPFDHGRLRQLRRWVSWHLLRSVRATFDLFGAGNLLDPRSIQARHESIGLPGLHPSLEGMRIAHLSDFHCGAYMSAKTMQRIFARVAEEKPDLIALTGDYVDFHPADVKQLVEPLAEMPAPPLGTFAVLGNHDFMHGDINQLVDLLTQGDVRCLRNESVRIERDGGGFWLTGVEDHWRGTADFAKALRQITSEEPRILLCHTPDVVGHARDHDYALMLSGHTHGGQFVFPYFGPAKVYSVNGPDFIGGSVEVPPTTLHVSRGIGMAAIPLRINCPPEFSVLTLNGK